MKTDVVIIGAGLSGLSAACELKRQNIHSVVFDKAVAVGGRLATRRIDEHVFDHGAQFFTTRSAEFRAQVDTWINRGIVREWYRGLPGTSQNADQHPRYTAIDGMTRLAKDLAGQLTTDQLQLNRQLTAIRRQSDQWQLDFKDLGPVYARYVLLTAPVPQAAGLLADDDLAAKCRQIGDKIGFDPCLALLVIVDQTKASVAFPPPGGRRFASDESHGGSSSNSNYNNNNYNSGILSWGADNYQKGISPVSGAVTLHATAEFSRRQFDADPELVASEMLRSADLGTPQEAAAWQLKKWRYATPVNPLMSGYKALDPDGTLLLAGDAFAGARVEGAWISGVTAARQIVRIIQSSGISSATLASPKK